MHYIIDYFCFVCSLGQMCNVSKRTNVLSPLVLLILHIVTGDAREMLRFAVSLKGHKLVKKWQ